MSSWAQASVTVFGEKLLWTDILGNVFSLATVWLAIRRTIWTWPVQLTGAVLLFVASVSAHAPGNALKQVMFLLLVSYGWVKWVRGIRETDELPVRPATVRERALLIGALAAGTGARGAGVRPHPLAADHAGRRSRTRTSSSAARSRPSRRAARSSTSG